MFRTRSRAMTRACAAVALTVGVGLAVTPAALAHDAANCAGYLAQAGATYQGSCTMPFQGYPIGMAAVYTPGDTTHPGDIHVEVLLKQAFAPPQALAMECYDPEPNPDGTTPLVYRTTRCKREYDAPQTDSQFTLVEAIPTEVVGLQCSAHSHARYSRLTPPSGEFACWSTNEARQDLENDGILGEIGY